MMRVAAEDLRRWMIAERLRGQWQCPAEALPERGWDVLVIGAGPAGATTALHLARQGHAVLLLDRAQYPRDKVCGDGLIADALHSLARAGLLELVQAIGCQLEQIAIFSSSQIEFNLPGTFLTLRRQWLDALLARRAVEEGACFAQGRAGLVSLERDGSIRCTMAGSGRILRATVGVIATGARIDLARHVGLVSRPEASGFAMRCYVRSELGIDHLVVSFDKNITPGYGWIFPLGNQEYNIGCGVVHDEGTGGPNINLHDVFKSFVERFPLARHLMHHGRQLTPLRGAMLRCGLSGAQPLAEGGRLLAIGETIGATYPFTGEGIGKAMETGELAAEAIHHSLASGDPAPLRDFPDRLRSELGPIYPGYQLAQDWFARPWLNNLIAWRVRHSRYLRGAFADLLTEAVRPERIFSLRGLLRSFVA